MEETLYKVGDRVVVIEDLREDEDYHMEHNGESDCATLYMTTFRGRVVTIKECYDYGYRILEDNEKWNWTDEMFSLGSNLITKEKLDKISRG